MNTKKTVVLIEDKISEFNMIGDCVKACGYSIYPNDHQSFLELKASFMDYLAHMESKQEFKLIKLFDPNDVACFIVDFGLTGRLDRYDPTGGIIRKKLLLKHFPDAKVLFFSMYPFSVIREYMEPGLDTYINKNTVTGEVKNKYYRYRISEYLKRL